MDARQSTIEYVRKQDDKRPESITRQSSYIKIYNALLDKETILESTGKLGRGTYGQVRQFENPAEDTTVVAIKKPRSHHIEHEFEKDMLEQQDRARNELLFTQRAYPGDGPFQLFEFIDIDTTNSHYRYDSRLMLPFRDGSTLYAAAASLRPQRDILFYIFYRIAKEVNRLHQECSIIHGDLSAGNIIISPELTVKIIDFSFACTTGSRITTFELEPNQKTYIAPERINAKRSVKGHPLQDVYTLAVVFKQIYQMVFDFADQLRFLQHFPCIENFITDGLNNNPSARQSLPELIANMQKQMFMPKMMTYAYLAKKTELRLLLGPEQFMENREEIYQSLINLLERKHTNEAHLIIHQLHKVAQAPRDKAILDLFTYIIYSIQDVARIHTSGFRQALRHRLIEDLLIALKLVKLVVNQSSIVVTPSLNFEIYSASSLKEIYRSLIDAGCIVQQRLDLDSEDLTCVFN